MLVLDAGLVELRRKEEMVVRATPVEGREAGGGGAGGKGHWSGGRDVAMEVQAREEEGEEAVEAMEMQGHWNQRISWAGRKKRNYGW